MDIKKIECLPLPNEIKQLIKDMADTGLCSTYKCGNTFPLNDPEDGPITHLFCTRCKSSMCNACFAKSNEVSAYYEYNDYGDEKICYFCFRRAVEKRKQKLLKKLKRRYDNLKFYIENEDWVHADEYWDKDVLYHFEEGGLGYEGSSD